MFRNLNHGILKLVLRSYAFDFSDIQYYLWWHILLFSTELLCYYGLPGVESEQQQRSIWRNNRWNCDRLCHLRGPICGRGLELHVPLRRNLRHADEDLRQTPGQQTVCQLMSRRLDLAWQRSLSWHVSVLWCYRISYLQTYSISEFKIIIIVFCRDRLCIISPSTSCTSANKSFWRNNAYAHFLSMNVWSFFI